MRAPPHATGRGFQVCRRLHDDLRDVLPRVSRTAPSNLAGETLLVLGAAGGVGSAAVELGKAMGARVIAAASSDDKLEVCRDNGADELINYATEDLRERVKVITAGKGVDVVYDPVGGPYSEPALRDMAWNGRFLVIGFAAGDIPKIPLNLPCSRAAPSSACSGARSPAKSPTTTAATTKSSCSCTLQARSSRTFTRRIRWNALPKPSTRC